MAESLVKKIEKQLQALISKMEVCDDLEERKAMIVEMQKLIEELNRLTVQ